VAVIYLGYTSRAAKAFVNRKLPLIHCLRALTTAVARTQSQRQLARAASIVPELSHGGATSNILAISKPKPDIIMTLPSHSLDARCWEALRDFGQLDCGALGCIFGRRLPIAMKKSADTSAIARDTLTG
jgi:hypothetical protein